MKEQINSLALLIEAVRRKDFYVLDTETTGLQRGEICQIAILSHDGQVCLNTFVKTARPIPESATSIHGITDDMVADSPTWDKVERQVLEIVAGHDLMVYNALYDRKMMHQSREFYSPHKIEWKDMSNWYCAMEAYAEYWGAWNEYHQSYRWQRLTDAIIQQQLSINNPHSALGDCMATLALVNKMAQQ